MRSKWLGSFTGLLVTAGAVFAQSPSPVSWKIPQDQLPALSELPPVVPPPNAPTPAPPTPLPPVVAVPAPLKGSPPLTIPAQPSPLAPVPVSDHVATCAACSSDPAAPVTGVKFNDFTSGSSATFWFDADYLLWWVKDGRLPPLIGQISTADARSGNISSITTIYGGSVNDTNYHEQSGVRLSTGVWVDEAHTLGIDASFFQLEHKTQGVNLTSPGDPVIGPVFDDPVQLQRTILLAAVPNFTSGALANVPRSATIGVTNNNDLWSAELNGRYQMGALFFMDRLDLVVGYRQLYFGEGLDVTTESVALSANAGPNVLATDHFGTRTQFYGGQVGISSHGQYGRLSFDSVFKLGMGDIHEALDINGSTTIGGITYPGGVLTQPTNMGHGTIDRFGILPEITLTAGYQLTAHLRATVGYNFLYLSNVLRAGDQVDLVDGRQVRSLTSFDPTATNVQRPLPTFYSDRFYAQGLNFGLEFSY